MPKKEKKKAAESATGGTPPTEHSDSSKSEPTADGEADEEVEEEEKQVGNKRDGSDISKVTDYVEQKELDSAKASKAIASIGLEQEVDREAELQRERELAAVTIDAVCTALQLGPCKPT